MNPMGLERIRKTSPCASTGSATPAPGFPGVPEALGEEEARPCPRANPSSLTTERAGQTWALPWWVWRSSRLASCCLCRAKEEPACGPFQLRSQKLKNLTKVTWQLILTWLLSQESTQLSGAPGYVKNRRSWAYVSLEMQHSITSSL